MCIKPISITYLPNLCGESNFHVNNLHLVGFDTNNSWLNNQAFLFDHFLNFDNIL